MTRSFGATLRLRRSPTLVPGKADDCLFYVMRDGACPEDRFPSLDCALRRLNLEVACALPLRLAEWAGGCQGFRWLLRFLDVRRWRGYGVLVVYDGDVLVNDRTSFPSGCGFPFEIANPTQPVDLTVESASASPEKR